MRALTLSAVALLLASPAIVSAHARFTSLGVEFAPADQRVSMAERYVQASAAPGTPLPTAEAAMRRADAPCAREPEADGAIRCRFSRSVSNSAGDMPLGDVTWTVRLYPTADGRIARTTVVRDARGL